MSHCEVSSNEFEELKFRFARLLTAAGFQEVTCPNMRLGPGETYKPFCYKYSCNECFGTGLVLEKSNG